MAMRALLWSFGGAEQDEHGNVTINSKQTVEALKFMKALYQETETSEVFTWTPEYASKVVRSLFDRNSPITRHTSGGGAMFVFIQRINLGLYGLFASLRATGNWRRIAEELWPMVDAAPSTELGRKEAGWLERATMSA